MCIRDSLRLYCIAISNAVRRQIFWQRHDRRQRESLPEQMRGSTVGCIFQNISPLIVSSLCAISESNKNHYKPGFHQHKEPISQKVRSHIFFRPRYQHFHAPTEEKCTSFQGYNPPFSFIRHHWATRRFSWVLSSNKLAGSHWRF